MVLVYGQIVLRIKTWNVFFMECLQKNTQCIWCRWKSSSFHCWHCCHFFDSRYVFVNWWCFFMAVAMQ